MVNILVLIVMRITTHKTAKPIRFNSVDELEISSKAISTTTIATAIQIAIQTPIVVDFIICFITILLLLT